MARWRRTTIPPMAYPRSSQAIQPLCKAVKFVSLCRRFIASPRVSFVVLAPRSARPEAQGDRQRRACGAAGRDGPRACAVDHRGKGARIGARDRESETMAALDAC